MRPLKKSLEGVFVFCLVIFIFSTPLRAGEPKRIISLKPNITEILFALGVGNKVVGVTTWCDWPEDATKLPKVADYIHPNIEKIIALRPDLIIGSRENSDSRGINQLNKLGYKILLLPFGTIEELYSSTLELGAATQNAKESEILVSKIKKGIKEIQTSLTHKQPPKVLVVVGRRPLIVAGPETFLDELLKTIHAINIAGTSKIHYPNMSLETIVAERPDVIIDLTMGSEISDGALSQFFKKTRTVSLPIKEFRAGPRIVEAIKTLEEAVYPNE